MAGSAAWRPIGTILVESGAITPDDLDAALREQKLSGRKLGEILIESGRITWLELAHAIAEQAADAEAPPTSSPEPVPAQPPVSVQEPEPEPEPVALPEPPLTPAPAPAVLAAPPVTPAPFVPGPPVSGAPVGAGDEMANRLETVEGMLKERQRAFLELVSVTERLRATVARLQDELAQRDAEIARLRSGATTARAV